MSVFLLGAEVLRAVALYAVALRAVALYAAAIHAVVPRMRDLHAVGPVARAPVGDRLGLAPRAFDVGDGVQRRGLAQRLAGVVLDADDAPGVRVHHQPHRLAGQLVGHLEALAQVRHGAVLPHEALDPVVQQRVELRGLGAQRADLGQIALVTRQRRQSPEAAMRRAMVDLLQPGPQPRVEIVQIGDAPLIELAEELVPYGLVPALQLTLAGRLIRAAKNQVDAQSGTDALQRIGPVRGAIVNDYAGGAHLSSTALA